jgi:hypothetical protein
MLKFEPDASLAFPGHQPFLVIEVAVTQDAEVAKKKARDYIRGSHGKIVFVVVIIVKGLKMPRDRQGPQGGHQSNTGERLANKDLADQVTNETLNDKQPEGAEQGESTDHNRGEESPSPISNLRDPLSDSSKWSSSVSIPPLLYKYLNTNEVLNPNDTVYISVFKSVTRKTVLTVQPLIEEVEVYPHTTAASFTIVWTDIVQVAPANAGPSLNVSLQPLSLLAQTLAEGLNDELRSPSSWTGEYLSSSE